MDVLLLDQSLADKLSDGDLVGFLWSEAKDQSRIMTIKQFLSDLSTIDYPRREVVDLQQPVPEVESRPPVPKERVLQMPRWIETACFMDANGNACTEETESDKNQLARLQFSRDHVDLLAQDERQKCPKCRELRKYYCYDCLLPFTEIPAVRLPVKIAM